MKGFCLVFLVIFAVGASEECALHPRTDMSEMDTAQLVLKAKLQNPTSFSRVIIGGQNSNCFECDFEQLAVLTSLTPSISANATVPSAHEFSIQVTREWQEEGKNSTTVLQTVESYYLGDREVVSFSVDIQGNGPHSSVSITRKQLKAGYHRALPLIVAAVIVACIAVIYVIAFLLWRSCKSGPVDSTSELDLLLPNESFASASLNADNDDDDKMAKAERSKMSNRIRSLDCFRGICIIIMVFVNYGGGGYWYFNHSIWNGLTVADLVFPWFIFVMGVSIALSMSSVFEKLNFRWGPLVYKIFRRTAILFALGLVVNNSWDVTHIRIPGVLQRFAVSYFFTVWIFLLVPKIGSADSALKRVYVRPLLEWLVAVVFLVAWLALTFLLPVPGCPKGYLGPGGIGDHGLYYDCTGGAAGYIDRQVFGLNHMYGSPTCQETYQTGAYDPEGLLGCLTSIFLCYLGVHCGRLFVEYRKKNYGLMYINFLAWGFVLAMIGVGLSAGSKNSGIIPISKNLWSLSFILVMAGTGFILLSLLYELIDRLSFWNGSPFRFVGMNSIAIYVGHELLAPYFPFSWKHAATHTMTLLANSISVTLWVLIAWYMHVLKFYVKI